MGTGATAVGDPIPDAGGGPPDPAGHGGSGPPQERPEQRARRAPRVRPARGRRPGADPRLVRLVALASLPVVAASALALLGGWTALGDNATLALRAGDVAGGHPPLTGMPSTADTLRDPIEVDHPGPLEVWAAAIPVALIGPAGLLVTVAAVNLACLAVAVRVAFRRAGPSGGALAAALAVALCWSLGATVIRDPLNSHAPVLPWFCLLVLAWDLRLGRARSLPPAVAVACWVTQAHVVYLPMVAIVGATTAVALALEGRRSRAERMADGTAPTAARRWRRPSLVAIAVGVALYLPALIDQVAGSGNLGRMVTVAGGRGIGWHSGVANLARALGWPPAWLRRGNDPFWLLSAPSVGDVLAAAATIGLLGWTLVAASQRRDRPTLAAAHTAVAALAALVVTVARTPVGGAVLAADPLLLTWPTTAFAAFALGIAAQRRLRVGGLRVPTTIRRWLTPLGAAAAVAVTVATISAPGRFGGFGEGLMDEAAAVDGRVSAVVRGQGLVQVNASGWAARLYLAQSVIERLERDGIAVRTGTYDRPSRRGRSSQGAPTATVWVVSGDRPPDAPARDTFLVARLQLVEGGQGSGAAQRRRRIADLLAGSELVRLRDTDRLTVADVTREYFRWKSPPPHGSATLPSRWVSIDAYVDLASRGMVVSPRADPALLAQLRRDAVGRYFAAGDTELAVWVRFEPTR